MKQQSIDRRNFLSRSGTAEAGLVLAGLSLLGGKLPQEDLQLLRKKPRWGIALGPLQTVRFPRMLVLDWKRNNSRKVEMFVLLVQEAHLRACGVIKS